MKGPLLQERYGREDPWRIAVVCKLLNKVRGSFSEPIVADLLEKHPTAESMSKADAGELARTLRPLGLQNRRAAALTRMSEDFASGKRAEECFGVGRYCVESLRMFVLGDLEFEPEDSVLRARMKTLRRKR